MLLWNDILPEEACLVAKSLEGMACLNRKAGHIVYPSQDQIFRALELTSPEQCRVCCLGQDPYHQPHQANGLAFSVNEGVPFPPSLRNIFKELHDDLGLDIPTSGDLTHWTKQGVLLLNTVLTVEEGKPKSHDTWGWQTFTEAILGATRKLPQSICFILWGGSAQSAAERANVEDTPYPRLILRSVHPSPLSAYRGFFGSKPFSKANDFLIAHGATPINW